MQFCQETTNRVQKQSDERISRLPPRLKQLHAERTAQIRKKHFSPVKCWSDLLERVQYVNDTYTKPNVNISNVVSENGCKSVRLQYDASPIPKMGSSLFYDMSDNNEAQRREQIVEKICGNEIEQLSLLPVEEQKANIISSFVPNSEQNSLYKRITSNLPYITYSTTPTTVTSTTSSLSERTHCRTKTDECERSQEDCSVRIDVSKTAINSFCSLAENVWNVLGFFGTKHRHFQRGEMSFDVEGNDNGNQEENNNPFHFSNDDNSWLLEKTLITSEKNYRKIEERNTFAPEPLIEEPQHTKTFYQLFINDIQSLEHYETNSFVQCNSKAVDLPEDNVSTKPTFPVPDFCSHKLHASNIPSSSSSSSSEHRLFATFWRVLLNAILYCTSAASDTVNVVDIKNNVTSIDDDKDACYVHCRETIVSDVMDWQKEQSTCKWTVNGKEWNNTCKNAIQVQHEINNFQESKFLEENMLYPEQWLFCIRKMAEFGYGRNEFYSQTITVFNCFELMFALLWLTDRFHLIGKAAIIRLRELSCCRETRTMKVKAKKCPSTRSSSSVLTQEHQPSQVDHLTNFYCRPSHSCFRCATCEQSDEKLSTKECECKCNKFAQNETLTQADENFSQYLDCEISNMVKETCPSIPWPSSSFDYMENIFERAAHLMRICPIMHLNENYLNKYCELNNPTLHYRCKNEEKQECGMSNEHEVPHHFFIRGNHTPFSGSAITRSVMMLCRLITLSLNRIECALHEQVMLQKTIGLHNVHDLQLCQETQHVRYGKTFAFLKAVSSLEEKIKVSLGDLTTASLFVSKRLKLQELHTKKWRPTTKIYEYEPRMQREEEHEHSKKDFDTKSISVDNGNDDDDNNNATNQLNLSWLNLQNIKEHYHLSRAFEHFTDLWQNAMRQYLSENNANKEDCSYTDNSMHGIVVNKWHDNSGKHETWTKKANSPRSSNNYFLTGKELEQLESTFNQQKRDVEQKVTSNYSLHAALQTELWIMEQKKWGIHGENTTLQKNGEHLNDNNTYDNYQNEMLEAVNENFSIYKPNKISTRDEFVRSSSSIQITEVGHPTSGETTSSHLEVERLKNILADMYRYDTSKSVKK